MGEGEEDETVQDKYTKDISNVESLLHLDKGDVTQGGEGGEWRGGR